MLILLLCITLFCLYIHHYLGVYTYWRKKGVVGPTPWPIVGNYGPVLFGLKQEPQLIQELYENYPDEKCLGMFIGSTPTIVVKDLDMIMQVLTKDFANCPNRKVNAMLSPFKDSLFVARDEQWNANRKILTTMSNKTKMSKVTDAIESALEAYLDRVENLVRNTQTQDLYRLMQEYFFVVTCSAVLGEERALDVMPEIESEWRFLTKLEPMTIIRKFDVIFPWSYKILANLSNFMLYFTTINCRRFMATAIKSHKMCDRRGTYTDLILELQEDINQRRPNMCNDLLVEIHLTTIAAAVYMGGYHAGIYMAFSLAQNQDIQQKCYEDICQALDKHGGVLCMDSLTEMKYLNMVLQECLRLYQTTPIAHRVCSLKHCLAGTNIIIDPGTLVFIPNDAIAKDEKVFTDSTKFYPERYSPDKKDQIHPHARTSFGSGPRQCIGKYEEIPSLIKVVTPKDVGRPIAEFIIKMNVAAFLRRFKIEPSNTISTELSYKRRLQKGDQVFLNITKRE